MGTVNNYILHTIALCMFLVEANLVILVILFVFQ